MKYYPAFLDLRGRPCLVIGGGAVAERKALSLLEAGAEVTIVSPRVSSLLADLAASGKVTHRSKTYEDKDLAGEFLVIAATGSTDTNVHVARECKKKRVLVNVVSPPGESTFIVPSLVERGELLIAISTCGASPALSRKIRLELEGRYGREYGLLLEKLSAFRARVIAEISDEHRRRSVFQALVDSDIVDLLQQGRMHDADLRMAEIAGLKHRG